MERGGGHGPSVATATSQLENSLQSCFCQKNRSLPNGAQASLRDFIASSPRYRRFPSRRLVEARRH